KKLEDIDQILMAIGHKIDLNTRPELSSIVNHIKLWEDAIDTKEFATPEYNSYSNSIKKMPYLGYNFELQEKKLGSAPYLNSIFVVNGSSMLSKGLNVGLGISGMKHSIQFVIDGVSRSLFLDQKELYLESIINYDQQLFTN
ncbi:MAG: hypothetical protein ACKOAD_00295, partial [Gammaproteobacteria bacterium]